jgi:hypothetical protein
VQHLDQTFLAIIEMPLDSEKMPSLKKRLPPQSPQKIQKDITDFTSKKLDNKTRLLVAIPRS